MKISCQSCQSKYNVADEKVEGKIVKIRCRKCGSTIVVNGTGAAGGNSSVGPEPPQRDATTDSAESWHVNVSESDQRSMTLPELIEAYNSGVITQETFIWTDGMDDWKPLSEVDAVVSALHAHVDMAKSAPPADEIPNYAASVVPAYEAAPQASAYEEPQVSSPAYAAPAYESQVALGGEPKRAAVVKREARGRDLFGTASGDDIQTSAPAVMPSASSREADDAASKLTGERNENSVLFSLAVLTQGGDERAPQEAPPMPQKDDSGLIDLKALAARTESLRPSAPRVDGGEAFAAPLGFAPPPPLGALGTMAGEAAPKSKLPFYIGLAAGAVLLVLVSVVVTFKIAASNAPPPAPSVAAAPTQTAEPPPSATAESSAAAATPSASVAATSKPKPVVGGGATYHAAAPGPAKPPGPSGGATTPTSPTPAPAAAAPPKKNDCGCNGDLMCMMKCSTK